MLKDMSSPLKVRYNTMLAGVMLVVGAGSGFLSLWVLALGGRNYASVVPAVVCLLIGFGYLTRPQFWVESNAVVVPALIGPVKRTFSFTDPSQVRMQGNRLEVNTNGQWKKVPVVKWLANQEDWKALESRFAAQ